MHHSNHSIMRPSIRMGVSILAILSSATIALQAATQEVTMKLGGKDFAHGKSLVASSGSTKTIFPSQRYTYKISGSIRGKGGQLQVALPDPIPFSAFLTSVNLAAPQVNAIVDGSFANPSGALPATIMNQTLTGSKKIKGLGKVTLKCKVSTQIDAGGKISFRVTKVSIKTDKDKVVTGAISFVKGSTLVVSTAPIVEFKSAGQPIVNETAGTVEIIVTRQGNQKQAATVQFETVDGTALAGSDYVSTTGTVTFQADDPATPANENEQMISIPLTISPDKRGFRQFSVRLISASTGAILGTKTTTTVNISSDS
jgi:hypothetical protein